MSCKIVNLNVKLSFLPLYFALSKYIFSRFASSFLYPWLTEIWLYNVAKEGFFVDILLSKLVGLMMGGMDRDKVEGKLSKESVIGVFFNLKLIWWKSNVPSDNR